MTAQEIADRIIAGLDLGEGIEATDHNLALAIRSGWFEGDAIRGWIARAAQEGLNR